MPTMCQLQLQVSERAAGKVQVELEDASDVTLTFLGKPER
jgi:hypothetical protein